MKKETEEIKVVKYVEVEKIVCVTETEEDYIVITDKNNEVSDPKWAWGIKPNIGEDVTVISHKVYI